MIFRNGLFAEDIKKYYRIGIPNQIPSLRKIFHFWINHPGFQCVAVYRFGQFAARLNRKNKVIGPIFKIAHWFLKHLLVKFYHVYIGVLEIGPGFYINHIGTIYIGARSIGKNFSVTHNVTIGVGRTEGKEGKPIIGDNVYVGTGATIVGRISIGNNVTIMPGAFVSRDIPEGCLVGGNPARIVSQNYDNKRMFDNVPPDNQGPVEIE